MEFYTIRVERSAAKDLKKIKQSGKKSDISKIERIFKELTTTPYEGEGSPERLKYDLSGYWSRRINKKDRMVYKVNEDKIVVTIVSALGHYFDK